MDGASLTDRSPSGKRRKTIRQAIQMTLSNPLPILYYRPGVWYYGKKADLILVLGEILDTSESVYVVGPHSIYWDDYRGQKTVVFGIVERDHFGAIIEQLIALSEKTPVNVPLRRDQTVKIRPERVFVLCTSSIENIAMPMTDRLDLHGYLQQKVSNPSQNPPHRPKGSKDTHKRRMREAL